LAIDDKKIEEAVNVLKSIQTLDDLKENKEEVLNIIEGFIVDGVKILKDILTKSLAPDEVQKELENFQVGQEAFGEELEKEMDRISEIPGAEEFVESLRVDMEKRLEPHAQELADTMGEIMGSMMGGMMEGIGEIFNELGDGEEEKDDKEKEESEEKEKEE